MTKRPAPFATHLISGYGGCPISVAEYGTPDGPPILFVHGWSQAHLSFARQFTSPALAGFRMVGFDLRGHGASGKPTDPEAYAGSAPWGGDIAAVIEALSLSRPLLLGWSMGGKALCDYLALHGDAALSGTAMIGTGPTSGKYIPPEARELRMADPDVLAKGMLSEVLAENLSATEAFLHACFHQQPAAEDFAAMMGFNMMCPPEIRGQTRQRHADYRPAARATQHPCLVVWGAHERVMPKPIFDECADEFAHAEAHVFEHSGHAPFWEEPERFNALLAAFATRLFGGAST
ncbi:alpha/beta fold hydrolase [Oceanicola sp. D3]|uniref:alpha/beta fold hydrolase n=1 Tax=Oceanicola sp. D3 TaxID=2587163 RepID=UPI00143D7C1D|nr:alpha/beta hydrolase [Oceanicola sp. D3]